MHTRTVPHPTRTARPFFSIGLWLLQILLAFVFLAHGWLFLAPPAELAAIMNAQLTPAFRLFLGVAEVLAAVSLIVPGITRIVPWLTVWAAVGLMIVMVSATVLHVVRGELSSALTTAILLILVTLVAYGRWQVRPLTARMVRAK